VKKTLDLFSPAKLSLAYWKQDAIAGAIVAVVAIPLCLALAIASGVPPVYGVYTSIIAGIIVAFFGGTELGVAGPAAAMTVLLYATVTKFGFEGLMLAGLIAGLIQIGMGITGIGRVVKFVPYTVIVGFTTGIGFLIIIGQAANFLGVNPTGDGVLEKAVSLVTRVGSTDLPTLGLAAGTLALIFVLRRLVPKVPASFAALVIASVAATAAGLHVKTIGTVPAQLPSIMVPPVTFGLLGAILPAALAIALLASIESLLSAVSADGMMGTKHSSSKELVGQGIANVILPFFGAIPSTGVIVRTATNIKNGGKTRLSAIIHSLVLLLVLLLLSPLASAIPMAVLAAILVYTALHLISVDEIKHFAADSKGDSAVLAATVGATVFLDLPTAILMGFTLAGLAFMKKMSETVEVTLVPQAAPASEATTLAPDVEGIARTYRISGALFFGSAVELEKIAEETPEKQTPALVLDLLQVDYVDSSSLAILAGLAEKHKRKGEVYIAVTNATVKRKILNSSVMKSVDPYNLVSSVQEGLTKAKQKYGGAAKFG
jgi:SulP family sulfate permease